MQNTNYKIQNRKYKLKIQKNTAQKEIIQNQTLKFYEAKLVNCTSLPFYSLDFLFYCFVGLIT